MMKFKPFAALLVLCLSLGLTPGSAIRAADAILSGQQTGVIKGRVFNPASQEYVRNAEVSIDGTNLSTFSSDDGSYALSNVPAGNVSVSVAYTGYDRAASTIVLPAGQTVTRDFELKAAPPESGKARCSSVTST